jgi:hypothetical protein
MYFIWYLHLLFFVIFIDCHINCWGFVIYFSFVLLVFFLNDLLFYKTFLVQCNFFVILLVSFRTLNFVSFQKRICNILDQIIQIWVRFYDNLINCIFRKLWKTFFIQFLLLCLLKLYLERSSLDELFIIFWNNT